MKRRKRNPARWTWDLIEALFTGLVTFIVEVLEGLTWK